MHEWWNRRSSEKDRYLRWINRLTILSVIFYFSAGLKIVAGDRISRNYYNFEQGVGLLRPFVEYGGRIPRIYQPSMILMASCWPMRNIIDYIILSYLSF